MDELCRREARRAMIEKLKNPKCRKRDLTPLSSTAHSGDLVLPCSSWQKASVFEVMPANLLCMESGMRSDFSIQNSVN